MPGLKFLFLRKKNSFAEFGGEGEVWGIWTSRQPVLEGPGGDGPQPRVQEREAYSGSVILHRAEEAPQE